MTLDERRRLLKQAAASSAGVADFRVALSGASEEERVALARVLPPGRLLKAEGPTERATYVLAALGKGPATAEGVWPLGGSRRSPVPPGVLAALVDAGRERPRAWLEAFIAEVGGWWEREAVWTVIRRLVVDRDFEVASENYLHHVLYQPLSGGRDQSDEVQAQAIVAFLRADPLLLESEIWSLFRVEGTASDFLLTSTEAWTLAVGMLAAEDVGFRNRVLEESLAALLRDFAPSKLTWYLRVHRHLSPRADEVRLRQATYLAVLGTQASAAVGLAQECLAMLGPDLDADAIVAASAGVLGRREKKVIKAQLKLLSGVLGRRPDLAGRCAQLIADHAEGWASDVMTLALPLQGTVSPLPAPGGESVLVAPPRSSDLPPLTWAGARPTSTAETRDLVAAHLEGLGDGADLPGIIDALRRNPRWVDATLADRARTIRDSIWDPIDASPRRQLADLVVSCGGGAVTLGYQGWRRHVYLGAGEPVPPGWNVSEQVSRTMSLSDDNTWVTTETHTYQSGYRSMRTNALTALLVAQFAGPVCFEPVDARWGAWERLLQVPGEGAFGEDRVLGGGVRPCWLTIGAEPVGQVGPFAAVALDVAAVAAEWTFRAQESREQDGFDHVAEWAAWLLQHNPDHLAAHWHPALWSATEVVNVRGVEPVLLALGRSRRRPGAPVYSALGLGLSAKMAEQRASAAEAVAALAASGLLDPGPFARELGAHLADRFVLAGRLAPSLADAASISALAGYRVLETLVALLPSAGEVNQGAKLVDLTAKLATEYGVSVTLTEGLLAKAKGASVLAKALRALSACQESVTALAREAAGQAEQAREADH